MRILHLADVHVGVESYGRPATEDDLDGLPDTFARGVDRIRYLGMSTRLLDFLSALDEAVEFALANDVDLVLVAGDLYKNRDPSQTHQRELAQRIARLGTHGIAVFLTVGNHDLPHVLHRASAVEIFPILDAVNVTVGDTLTTYRVQTRSGEAQVVALPWVRMGQFMAREETRGLTLEQITREVEQRLTDLLREQMEGLDGAAPALLCGHVTASGATLGSERTMMLGKEHVLTLGTLADRALDYVALGNIHRYQVLSRHPLVVYPGSIERVDFSEEDEEKGFCVVDLDPARPKGERVVDFRFVPVHARPMLTVEARVQEGEDPTAVTLAAIQRADRSRLDGGIVRVRVEMPAAASPAFREPVIRQALAPAHHIAGIERRLVGESRSRLSAEVAESLTPTDALRLYLGSRNVSADREAQLLRYAERLIAEEMEGRGD